MSGALIVPAAGAGSRLGSAVAKALVPVAGVPMIRRILDLYAQHVDSVVVVASPSAHDALVATVGKDAQVVVQHEPTGMLDAILMASSAVPSSAGSVWITWCDQVAVEPATVQRLAGLVDSRPGFTLAMPTVTRPNPYIHFDRDNQGRISRVRQRREGDPMPAVGESDMGLFALSGDAYRRLLPMFASLENKGSGTGERNFLPFIPWVAARGDVVTFPCTDPFEAVGVNTPEELAAVEAHLLRRAQR